MFTHKSMFTTSKVKRSQNSVCGLPDGIQKLDQKYYLNIKSTNQNEKYPKKVCLVFQK
jgi:hypothetical protein